MFALSSNRLYGYAPFLQRLVTFNCKNNHIEPHLRSDFRTVHLKHYKSYNWNQYAELNHRLEAVPYIDLLNEGLEPLRRSLIEEDNKALADVVNWCSKVFDYNVTNGKKIRGIALLKSYCTYGFNMDDSSWNVWDSDGWKSAVTLAWCIEMLQAFFVVCDDIMDQSVLRRGEPCWYKQPNVGLCAINDSLMLQSGVYKLLQKHFGSAKCYSNILHEFLQVTHKTVYGQCIDMLCHPLNQGPSFEKFTFKSYKTLVEYKTSHYTFCLPVHLAMHLADRSSTEDFNSTSQLCKKLGLYFQSQDDYLDCFGDPKVTGKFGNDIREGKCTWFSVKFLEGASNASKKEFMECYGVNDEKSVSKVMELYNNSSLIKEFDDFDEELCLEICSLIESMNDIKGGLFHNLFSQLRKRTK